MKTLQPKLLLMVKTETISHKIRNKTKMPSIPTPIQCSPEIPSQSSYARRINKNNTNR
jgi:hypothetical protein